MIYNVSFDICATIICAISLFIMLFIKKDLRKASNRILFLIIITTLVACVFDIWSSVGNSYVDQYSYAFRDFLNFTFLFVYVSTACLFAWYIITLLGIRRRMKKPLLVLFFLPELIIFLLLVFNSTFRWIFYYDIDGIYLHGTMMYVLYGTGYLYLLLSVFLVIRFKNMLLKSQRYAAILFLIFSIVPIIVQQFIMPYQLIELFFQSIAILGFLTTVENFDAVHNPITSIYNRTAFVQEINQAIQNKTSLDVLIIKLSRSSYFELATQNAFRVNGFIAGVAEWVNSLSRSLDVYDCERGHFILLAYHDEVHNTQNLSAEICKRFREKWVYQNEEIIFPMQLCVVSIPQEIQTVEQMIQLVDLPYISDTVEPTIISAKEVGVELYKQTGDMPMEYQIGGEVLSMLDDFVARIPLLTRAECNILQYYINGHEISEIPELAYISIHTVRKHNKSIYKKMQVATKEELLLYVDLLFRSGRLDELEGVLSR
jgi:Response regulator containing a CheY-like receiver domain and an HTH DNA-binding domain